MKNPLRIILILLLITKNNFAFSYPSIIKIENARFLTKEEREYFPEKIPENCKPINVDIYVNDEMIKNIKSEFIFKNNDFFKKDVLGNKLVFTYFPSNKCQMKESKNIGVASIIKNEVEKWLSNSDFENKKKNKKKKGIIYDW